MVIKWTPWNVPMHRRLEVFWAASSMFIALVMGPLCCIIILYLLVSHSIVQQQQSIENYD